MISRACTSSHIVAINHVNIVPVWLSC